MFVVVVTERHGEESEKPKGENETGHTKTEGEAPDRTTEHEGKFSKAHTNVYHPTLIHNRVVLNPHTPYQKFIHAF
jgi:hypothetical protein